MFVLSAHGFIIGLLDHSLVPPAVVSKLKTYKRVPSHTSLISTSLRITALPHPCEQNATNQRLRTY